MNSLMEDGKKMISLAEIAKGQPGTSEKHVF